MKRSMPLAVLTLLPLMPLLIAGCTVQEPTNNAAAFDVNTVSEIDMPAPNAAAPTNTAAPRPASLPPLLDPPSPGTPGGLPDDRTPLAEGPFPEDGRQAAADVVQRYYGYLSSGQYLQAWLLWADGGNRSGMSAADFSASFAKYSEYHANVGMPGEIDAGAGQRYVTVPVQPYARLKANAAPVYMLGTVTLHRTDVDGATAEQRRWHIVKIDIKPVVR